MSVIALAAGGPAASITILVAGIAAVAAVVSAVVAAVSARSTKRLELQAQRTRELENRISERKLDVYRPMIDLFGSVIGAAARGADPPADDIPAKIAEFTTWITIYGSDDAIKAHHNFTQAAFNDAPTVVATRLYAEFILAARRDLGYPETTITAMQVMGVRVTDLYAEEEYRLAMSLPFDELCRRENWTPPWLTVAKANASLLPARPSEHPPRPSAD